MKDTVVIGFLGTKLDGGLKTNRWERWRPSVNLCQQDDFAVSRFELLADPAHHRTARRVADDIALVSPGTRVNIVDMPIDNPWDLESVYGALFDFADLYPWQPERERYLVHITTGTHVAQICQFLLTEARFIPGEILQLSPPAGRGAPSSPGARSVIDLDLSRYDRLANRFAARQQADLGSLSDGLPTRNAALARTLSDVTRIATRSRDPMLLSGPNGAGKSGLAGRIHELRRRRHLADGELVEASAHSLQSESVPALFGRRRGGGYSARGGLLSRARGGTLFLDDIEALPSEAQARLSAWLSTGRYRPLGSDTEESASLHLIAGSTLSPRELADHLRPDLLSRLLHWHFALPALRDRREDLPDQIEAQLLRESARTGRKVGFNAEALATYRQGLARLGDLPGNFHDLNASVSRLAAMADGARITVADVERELPRLGQAEKGVADSGSHGGSDEALLRELLGDGLEQIDPFDRPQLALVIRTCQRSRSAADAGRALFSVSREARSTKNDGDRVAKYLKRFGLSWSALKTTSQDATAP